MFLFSVKVRGRGAPIVTQHGTWTFRMRTTRLRARTLLFFFQSWLGDVSFSTTSRPPESGTPFDATVELVILVVLGAFRFLQQHRLARKAEDICPFHLTVQYMSRFTSPCTRTSTILNPIIDQSLGCSARYNISGIGFQPQ